MKKVEQQERGGVVDSLLLVALAILAVGLTPLLGIFLHAIKVSDRANKMTIANNLARDMAEEIRSRSFWDPDIAYHDSHDEYFYPQRAASSGNPQPFGLEKAGNPTVSGVDFSYAYDGYDSSKKRIDVLDDVDDYDGWCRGDECTDCDGGSSSDGLCVDNSDLEDYNGEKTGLPKAGDGFTRKVEVFNIYPNLTAMPHQMTIGVEPASGGGWQDDTDNYFLFFDFRDSEFSNYTYDSVNGSAKGNSSLKVIKVRVEYSGGVVAPFHVEDTNLAVLQLSN